MKQSLMRLACAGIVFTSLGAVTSAFAQSGGNGNGGNGSGGAHGAATAGMTYHSEPVSSPWNRVPGDMSKKPEPSDMKMQGMSSDRSGMPEKVGQ